MFLDFFDKIVGSISDVYTKLTTKENQIGMGGSVELFIEDRSLPFD